MAGCTLRARMCPLFVSSDLSKLRDLRYENVKIQLKNSKLK